MKRLQTIFREKGFRSLMKRNFLTVLALLLIPILLICLLLIMVFTRFQYNSLFSQADNSLLRISTQTDILMESMENLAFSTTYSTPVTHFVQYAEAPLTHQKRTALQQLQRSLPGEDTHSVSILFQSAASSYLVTTQVGVTVSADQDLTAFSYPYRRHLDIAAGLSRGTKVVHDRETISFCSQSSPSKGITATVIVDVSKSVLERQFLEALAQQGGIFFLVEPDGSTVVSSAESAEFDPHWLDSFLQGGSLPAHISFQGKEWMLLCCSSASSGWIYVQLFPLASFLTSRNLAFSLLALAFIALLNGSIFVSLNISMRLYRPIQIIIQLLHTPQKGTVDYYRTYCRQYDDMDMILTLIESSHFQQLAISAELEEQSRQLLQAQNYAMAVQMNPHFIFNTLDCINWRIKALPTDTQDISSAITDFSKIMRYALKQKGNVPLMEELNSGRIYMRLRNTLSADHIQVNWDIDETVNPQTPVPFLILQPLLENAVTHGLKDTRGGLLQIRCRALEHTLLLEVEDNGTGFAPEKLAQLASLLQESTIPEDAGHIGLLNTHNRLRLSFGDSYGLQIESIPGRTVVSLRLPLQSERSV